MSHSIGRGAIVAIAVFLLPVCGQAQIEIVKAADGAPLSSVPDSDSPQADSNLNSDQCKNILSRVAKDPALRDTFANDIPGCERLLGELAKAGQ